MPGTARPIIALVAAAMLAGGCTSGAFLLADSIDTAQTTEPGQPKKEATGPKVGFGQFPDIPIPTGARMDVDRSLVLGSRDAWIGRLAMTIDRDVGSLYDFYSREMGKFGWVEWTSVRSEISILTYSRGNRVAMVQIRSGTLGGGRIDLTISPKDRTPRDLPGEVKIQPMR